jgi:hypothetical protein
MDLNVSPDLLLGVAVAGIAFSFVRSKTLRATALAVLAAVLGQILGEWLLHAGSNGLVDGVAHLGTWVKHGYTAVVIGGVVGGAAAMAGLLHTRR